MCRLGSFWLRFIGFQDLFTISRETRFFFIVTYGLSTVVMCYVGGTYVYIDVEGTTIAKGYYLRNCATFKTPSITSFYQTRENVQLFADAVCTRYWRLSPVAQILATLRCLCPYVSNAKLVM